MKLKKPINEKKNHFKFGLSDWVFNGLISRDSITLKHLNQKNKDRPINQ